MANSSASVPQDRLIRERQKRRRARRIRSLQAVWRLLLAGSLAGGLVWAITLPGWVIRQSEQIIVEGNHLLSEDDVRSLLPLTYPQSLLRVEPQDLAAVLAQTPPIIRAGVSRQLLPPELTVYVKERQPVAIARTLRTSSSSTNTPKAEVGFLDEQGVWIPKSFYSTQFDNAEMPTLVVIGSSQHYRSYWPEVYQKVSRSPVKVYEIDWQDPTNLILATELGEVHIGPYSSRFEEQLSILDRMRELPSYTHANQIDYIDLQNPDLPAIKMIQETESVESGTN